MIDDTILMQYDEGVEPVQRLCRLLQAGSAPPHLGLVERNTEKKKIKERYSILLQARSPPSSPSAPCSELTLCSLSSFEDRAPSPSGKTLDQTQNTGCSSISRSKVEKCPNLCQSLAQLCPSRTHNTIPFVGKSYYQIALYRMS